MRRVSLVTILSLALLPAALLTARTAQACSCMQTAPALESARSADAVFVGKLVSVANVTKQSPHGLGNKLFTFEVVRTFKGQLDAQVKIMTADNSAACGREYGAKGTEWLIYASIDDQGQVRDNLCSRTMPLQNAAADITEIEAAAGTLDQPNTPPSDPPVEPVEPGPADPEPAPVQPNEANGPESPGPAEPSKKGCSVNATEPAPLGLLGLSLGLLGMLSRRRR